MIAGAGPRGSCLTPFIDIRDYHVPEAKPAASRVMSGIWFGDAGKQRTVRHAVTVSVETLIVSGVRLRKEKALSRTACHIDSR